MCEDIVSNADEIIARNSFDRRKAIADDILVAMEASPNWNKLTLAQSGSLVAIAEILANILNDDHTAIQNWLDLSNHANAISYLLKQNAENRVKQA
jgi:hypothetical protein